MDENMNGNQQNGMNAGQPDGAAQNMNPNQQAYGGHSSIMIRISRHMADSSIMIRTSRHTADSSIMIRTSRHTADSSIMIRTSRHTADSSIMIQTSRHMVDSMDSSHRVISRQAADLIK